jgi:hypothetical protein
MGSYGLGSGDSIHDSSDLDDTIRMSFFSNLRGERNIKEQGNRYHWNPLSFEGDDIWSSEEQLRYRNIRVKIMPLASSGHKLVVRECSLVSDTAPGRVT